MKPSPQILISSFLLLSLFAGVGALVLSSREAAVALPVAEPSRPSPSQGAFVEEVPDDLLARALTAVPEVYPESALQPDNLTERLLLALGKSLEKKNPGGPAQDVAGAGLLPPSPEDMVQELLAQELTNPEVPLWEKGLGNERITVLFDTSPRVLADYQTKLNRILETRMGKVSTLIASGGQGAMDTGASELRRAVEEIKALPVPEPLAGMHWALLRSALYSQRALETGGAAAADPLGAMVAIRVNEEGFLRSFNAVEDELRNPTNVQQFLTHENNDVRWFALLFGVPRAHAQWFTFNAPQFAKAVISYIYRVAVSILQDILVHRLVQQTIKWIQGGGKPQFITNWKQFVKDAFITTANHAVNDLTPQLCTSFGPLVRVAILPVDPDREKYPSCTIDRIVANVDQFVDRFESGGWVAYGAALEPSNNFFGSLIQASEIINQKSAAGRRAASNDGESSSGGLSQRKCIKWDQAGCDDCISKNLVIGAGAATTQSIAVCAEACNKCLEELGTTPGDSVLGALSDTARAPLLRIVNAQDVTALINALVNAALTKLTQTAQTTVSGGVLGLKPFVSTVNACAGMTGDELKMCMGSFQKPECTQNTYNVSVQGTITLPDGSTVPASGNETKPAPNSADCTGGGITSP